MSELYTAAEAAKAAGICERKLRVLSAKGLVPTVKATRNFKLYEKSVIENFKSEYETYLQHYTPTDAGRYLGVSAMTVLRWIRAGKFETVEFLDYAPRIPRAVIHKYAEKVK